MKNYILFFALILWAYGSAHADLIRILHTNDLHGQILGSQNLPQLGGYAELKSMLDNMTVASEKEGIPVVRLDAGDFSEGSLTYKANDGLDVFQLMEMMGYDAVSLGNHDYLMGAQRLNELVGATNIPLVASNLVINPNFPFIQQKILPYRSFKKGAFSISVIGGTNGDVFYKWVLKGDIRFRSARKSINKYARRLKEESDLNIALSHMGVSGDKKLAASSRYLDLIVGGHNHIKLESPVYVKNRYFKPIPIFQLGDHGRYVGEILIDVDRSKPHGSRAKVISYNVHPIPHDGEKDQAILAKISETLSVLDQFYGENYLHNVLGYSTFPMESSHSRPTYWTSFFTDAIREEVMADVALNSSTFFGPFQASGEITRLKLMNFFPHFFDLKQREGWTIYTAEVKGHLIKTLMNLSFAAGYPFLVSGVSFETKTSRTGKNYVVNLKISDRPIDPFKTYKIAIPEGYYLGLHNSIPAAAHQILRNAVDTNISIWSAVARKVESENTRMVIKE